tara:strand:+ start:30 stop:524 length:495 start_codon:yes stop_codon:yes gene_type:complete
MDYKNLIDTIYTKGPDILIGLIIFFIFIMIAKTFQLMLEKLIVSKTKNKNISNIISGIAKNIIMIVGFITALGTVGINVSAIVAGLGLTGFAFSFAFKDMLSNFISGVLIFIYEPFQLNDFIIVDGKEGKVIDINLRYITLETEDMKILVPNSVCASKSVEVKK